MLRQEPKMECKFNIIRQLVERKASVNVVADGCFAGYTPLHLAYNTREAELLLNAKANLEAVTHRGETPLMLAVKKFDRSQVELLLARKANPHAINHAGQMALEYGSCSWYDDVFIIDDMLIKHMNPIKPEVAKRVHELKVS